MDLNNIYVRAKIEADFINEFPMNIYFAKVAEYSKFFKSHIDKIRNIFPRAKIDGKLIPLKMLCITTKPTF
jgi:hypothetical protein